jgi:hypothetical protein
MKQVGGTGLLVAWVCSTWAANFVVVNPRKPETFSDGEVGVMLDAVGREMEKSADFVLTPWPKLQAVLQERKLSRINICPDKSCLRDLGRALSADFVVTLEVTPGEGLSQVALGMFDMETGKAVAQASGEFNGPKSQMVLKFIPRQAKDLVRNAGAIAVRKDANKAESPEPAPQQAAAAKQSPSAPPPAAAGPAPEPPQPAPSGRNVLKSPGFWVPVVLLVAAPIAIVYYLTKNGGGGTTEDDGEMAFPSPPVRAAGQTAAGP